MSMEGWTEFTKIISAPGEWADLTKAPVTIKFYEYTDSGERSGRGDGGEAG